MRQFVADASHELRTPLTAIRGYAEYYRQRGGASAPARMPTGPATRTPGRRRKTRPVTPNGVRKRRCATAGAPTATGAAEAPSDLDRMIERVEQEATRMGVLVDDLLLLARLDQQRPLDFRTVDLLAIAADALHDARVIAPDRAINLTVGIAGRARW